MPLLAMLPHGSANQDDLRVLRLHVTFSNNNWGLSFSGNPTINILFVFEISPHIPENVDRDTSTIETAIDQLIRNTSTLIAERYINGHDSLYFVGTVPFLSARNNSLSLVADLHSTTEVVTAVDLLEAYNNAKKEHSLDYNQFLTGVYD